MPVGCGTVVFAFVHHTKGPSKECVVCEEILAVGQLLQREKSGSQHPWMDGLLFPLFSEGVVITLFFFDEKSKSFSFHLYPPPFSGSKKGDNFSHIFIRFWPITRRFREWRLHDWQNCSQIFTSWRFSDNFFKRKSPQKCFLPLTFFTKRPFLPLTDIKYESFLPLVVFSTPDGTWFLSLKKLFLTP